MTKGAATGRYLAVEALVRQEQNGYSNLVLDAMLRRSGLEPREKAFASAVFYGVLERQFTLDWMLAQCLRQPLAKLDAPVRAILEREDYARGNSRRTRLVRATLGNDAGLIGAALLPLFR